MNARRIVKRILLGPPPPAPSAPQPIVPIQPFLGPHRTLQNNILEKEWGYLHPPFDRITLLNFIANHLSKDQVILCELGVATGKTGNRLVEFMRGINVPVKYYGIDDLSLLGAQPQFEFPEMHFVNGNRDALNTIKTKIDFGFIDACHCAECVYLDSIAMSQHIKIEGFMGFHDTSVSAQYPISMQSKKEFQHYGIPNEPNRPLGVIEGISMGRAAWTGKWKLVVQDNDHLDWGGIRIYQRIE